MLSFPSRFTNTLSFSPSCWRMQAYIDVQPVKSRGATAVLVPAQDAESGMISSPRAHPRLHSSRLYHPISLRITEDRTEKVRALSWRPFSPSSSSAPPPVCPALATLTRPWQWTPVPDPDGFLFWLSALRFPAFVCSHTDTLEWVD
ncbi:hypothetical protein B0H13DRAFT_2358054 [Mycena leptocephala]|nr:hypothetical protein B0H13DRAFT_2358054 [Mycena leptocephala]